MLFAVLLICKATPHFSHNNRAHAQVFLSQGCLISVCAETQLLHQTFESIDFNRHKC